MFGGQLDGGQEVVRERVIGFPDLIQQLQLGVWVVSEVADQFAHPCAVLLLYIAAVVLLAGSAPGEGDHVRLAVVV